MNNKIGTGASTFTNVSSTMLPSGGNALGSETWSAAWADVNGDGRVDLFVGTNNSGSNTGDYLQNTGSGFINATSTVGLTDPGFHQNVAWGDFNNDRRLDLIIGQEGPELHQLYTQDDTGHFTARGAQVGIQVAYGTKSYGMAIGDTDSDGDMDVYISTCIAGGTVRNNFFRNNLIETGTLTFTDIADANGTQYTPNSYGSEFVDFDKYVRCFTFGKTDITPVHYDPKERKYLVEHDYLSPALTQRVVKDAQTINQALGYEMNTIEFAVKGDVPYAIDFLNPAPDFERDRITDYYFEMVLDKMSRLVIDRALNGAPSNSWPRWEEMLGIGAAAGFTGAPKAAAQSAGAQSATAHVKAIVPDPKAQ